MIESFGTIPVAVVFHVVAVIIVVVSVNVAISRVATIVLVSNLSFALRTG